jgi:E3 ubiquitin-protein ligase MARCH6
MNSGRKVLKISGMPSDHDVYNYSTGFFLCWVALQFGKNALKDMVNTRDVMVWVKVAMKWIIIAGKVAVLGSMWLIIPPMLIGLLFEVNVVIPFQTGPQETNRFSLLPSWAIGLILFKIWTK